MTETTDRIEQLRREASDAIAAAGSSAALEEVRIRFLGRKAELPNLLRGVAQLAPEQRAATGKAANQARQALEATIEARAGELASAELHDRLAQDRIDVTLPADPLPAIGRLHLMTRTRREIEDVFIGLGFNVAEGPEIETVYYNFDALNFTPTHPSRLESDTFYLKPADDLFDARHAAAAGAHLADADPRDGDPAAADLHHRPRPRVPARFRRHPHARSSTRSRGWRSTPT